MVVQRGFARENEEVEVDRFPADKVALKSLRRLCSAASVAFDHDTGDSDRESSDGSASTHSSDGTEQLSDPLLCCAEVVEDSSCRPLSCADVARAVLTELPRGAETPSVEQDLPPDWRRRCQHRRTMCYALLGLWMIAGWVGQRLYRVRERRVFEMIQQTSDVQAEAHDQLAMSELRVKMIQRDEVVLNRKNFRLKAETEATANHYVKVASGDELSEADTIKESFDRKKEHAEGLIKQLETLEQSIQNLSRRDVLEKYGDGPYYVRFELDYSAIQAEGIMSPREVAKRPSSFTVKLAPLDLMPHSVHLFLEQVSNGLWDGTSFIINAHHLIKAVPVPMSGDEDKATPFIDAGLGSPSFPEYSDDYPHLEFTLGFVGMPGAQGFFINTKDNSDGHGRGTQVHHKTGGGDPCFGEVINSDREPIRVLANLPTVDDGFFMRAPMGIKSAKVVAEPSMNSANKRQNVPSMRR